MTLPPGLEYQAHTCPHNGGKSTTLNAQRSTLNAQRSTLNAQRSTLNAQRRAVRTGAGPRFRRA
ncbi:MAG: hypothetical protein M0Q87_07040 [Ottowia sp.]|nr:hypothetical protein [Ottowia sp.]